MAIIWGQTLIPVVSQWHKYYICTVPLKVFIVSFLRHIFGTKYFYFFPFSLDRNMHNGVESIIQLRIEVVSSDPKRTTVFTAHILHNCMEANLDPGGEQYSPILLGTEFYKADTHRWDKRCLLFPLEFQCHLFQL